MIRLSLIFFTTITIIASCRKDPEVVIPIPYEVCACCNALDNLDNQIAGDTTDMFVQNLHEEITAGLNAAADTIYVDMEKDGRIDFHIISARYTWFGGGYYSSWDKIVSVNDSASISGTSQTDTLYSYDTTFYQNTNPVLKITQYTTSCIAESCCDSVHAIRDAINYFQEGDVIELDNSWIYSDLISENTGYEMDEFEGPILNDTMTLVWDHYNPECDNVSGPFPKYIAVKKINCGTEKLGWIKINQTSGNILYVEQIAIQK